MLGVMYFIKMMGACSVVGAGPHYQKEVMPISHKLRTLAAATAVSALALVGLPPASSQDLDESVSSKDARSMLVMDFSGSMLESDIDGGTRLDAAKTASTELIDSMPETANLGMMV